MTIDARRLSWAILLTAWCGAPSWGQTPAAVLPVAATSAQQMTVAARALLAALDAAELDKALFTLDAEERSHWSNVPYQAHHRPGVRIGDLDRERMLLVHELLRASLSSQGYQKVAGIIRLDDINRAQQVAGLAPDATPYAKAQAESFGSDAARRRRGRRDRLVRVGTRSDKGR
jgi:hypothetical protein